MGQPLTGDELRRPARTDSLMLSLNALFDRAAAGDLEATIALHLGDERFHIHIHDGELAVARGEVDDPDATLETDQTTLLSLLRTDRPLDEALANEDLQLTGNRGVIDTFRRLFPLPQPIPIADRT
jgi:alkyl sulfatase BDS1-like metallo-beta-lactamase superfamily hydrolase